MIDFLNRPHEISWVIVTDPETGRVKEFPGLSVMTGVDLAQNEDFTGASIVRMLNHPEENTITATVDVAQMFAGLPPKCRSRKRYIKLLMSQGLSRNSANLQAQVIRLQGQNWSTAWNRWLYFQVCEKITAELVSAVLPKKLTAEEAEIQCLKD